MRSVWSGGSLPECFQTMRPARSSRRTVLVSPGSPPAPAPILELVAETQDTTLRACVTPVEPLHRSGWGLRLPRHLAAGPVELPVASLLESSPFYARLEGAGDGRHALGEVADFRRFHSPLIRWMAHFRMRVERAA
jgi:carotenoid 1,2-hydratase